MNSLKKFLMTAIALALIIASPVSAGIEILGGPLQLGGGGGISFYHPTETADYTGTYWGTAMTDRWDTAMTALWDTTMNTEIP